MASRWLTSSIIVIQRSQGRWKLFSENLADKRRILAWVGLLIGGAMEGIRYWIGQVGMSSWYGTTEPLRHAERAWEHCAVVAGWFSKIRTWSEMLWCQQMWHSWVDNYHVDCVKDHEWRFWVFIRAHHTIWGWQTNCKWIDIVWIGGFPCLFSVLIRLNSNCNGRLWPYSNSCVVFAIPF